MKQTILSKITTLTLLISACASTENIDNQVKSKPNILFIAIDDLRPELACYGSPIAVTPNLDAIAQEGVRFNRAYCQQAICSPSRASLMTGYYPESTGIIENYTYFREVHPDIVTLPQHFRAHGYTTAYTGKIYHGKFTDEEKSWSRQPAKIDLPKPALPGGYALPENQEIFRKNQEDIRAKYGSVSHYALGRGPAFESADVPDYTYPDGYNALTAIATLAEMSKEDKPFFLGLGFRLPHLDWNAPQRYWDLYDATKIPLTDQPDPGQDAAAMGLHASFELRVRHGIPKSGPIDDELSKTLKHAYLASVSYVDAQIGYVMDTLEKLGLKENTIVMVWSDHGWHLGDMGVWGKATNYEIATRVPLLVSAPDVPATVRGRSTDALVELIDMFPTLCDLSGVAKPAHLEGGSFASLLQDPTAPWTDVAFSQYPDPALREWAANPLTESMRETYFGPLIREVESKIKAQQNWDRDLFENHLMGYAMRTDRYRLVLWKDRRKTSAPPIFVEIYDHQKDPKETQNIAAQEPELVAKLTKIFEQNWHPKIL